MTKNALAAKSPPYLSQLRTIFFVALLGLFAKVLFDILYQYRWYFPPDFEAASFLIGRRESFVGLYRLAFFLHIILSPVALLLGLFLVISGILGRHINMHRMVGRFQMMIVLFAVAPSGLVMSTRANTGAIAGVGFALLSILTAATVVMAVRCARRREFAIHRLWAMRCFILLCSPLLLRLFNGAAIVTQFESEWTYRMSAWLSWLVPLLLFEAYLRCSMQSKSVQADARSLSKALR